MNNKNILILILCLFSLSAPLRAANNHGQSPPQQSSSWWPDGKTVVTQSCINILGGVVLILVTEYLKKPTKSPEKPTQSPALQAREKAEAQLPTQLREKQAEIAVLTEIHARQTHTYNTLCAQYPSSPACQKRAEGLADLKSRLLELQDPIIDMLNNCITHAEQKHKPATSIAAAAQLPNPHLSPRIPQGN